MSLSPNFELTPLNSNFYITGTNKARLFIYGPVFYPQYSTGYRYSFNKQHENDVLYYPNSNAADPSLNFGYWLIRTRSPHIQLDYNLSSFGANKELALVFGFDATLRSRLLVYSDSGQLADITLEVGDNQFLMEIESIDSMYLYFIHARHDNSDYGGSWFFRGITGYVV